MSTATRRQVTTLQWFRLPKADRAERVRLFRAADISLQCYPGPDGSGRCSEDDPIYSLLSDRVIELWPTLPWWRR
jgi:hypothetical protein